MPFFMLSLTRVSSARLCFAGILFERYEEGVKRPVEAIRAIIAQEVITGCDSL